MATPAALLADSTHKSAAYAGLAKNYAKAHETWLALHCQFASDLAAAQGALIETGLDATAFADSVAASLNFSQIDPSQPHLSALQARDAISRVLPEDRRGAWRDRLFHNLAYLDSLPPASPRGIEKISEDRLKGMSIDEYLAQKRQEQDDFRNKAIEAWDNGDSWGSIEGTYGADLAGFEAWLVERSRSIGDTYLLQAELIWTLACAALEQIPQMPEDYDSAVAMVRSRLAWAVGPQESASLAAALDN